MFMLTLSLAVYYGGFLGIHSVGKCFFLVGSVSVEADFRKMKLMDKKKDTFSSKQSYVRDSKFEPKIDKHVFQRLGRSDTAVSLF